MHCSVHSAEVVQGVRTGRASDTFRLSLVWRCQSLFWWLWSTQATLAAQWLSFTSTYGIPPTNNN